jgi:aminomethyltransferase
MRKLYSKICRGFSSSQGLENLEKTPLYNYHINKLKGKMVNFCGKSHFEFQKLEHAMPVQYPEGVMKEHLHCRANSGLFDVSHMGQVK